MAGWVMVGLFEFVKSFVKVFDADIPQPQKKKCDPLLTF
jgi:hypothetical protein